MDNKNKIILDLCGGTGAWGKPYKTAGYTVYNITSPKYYVEDYVSAEGFIKFGRNRRWIDINKIYGILAAPPCTVFSKASWSIKKINRNFKSGMETVRACLSIIWRIQERGAPLKFWALENPMGYLYNFLGYPYFYFQPWQFGETGFTKTKRVAIWGYFKKPAKTIRKRTIPYINSHSQAKKQLPENKEWYAASKEKRAITPMGFAKAFYEANK